MPKTAPHAPTHRRRHWLVNPPLQYQFIAILLWALLTLTMGALASVYFALWWTMETYGTSSDPAAIAHLSTVGIVVTLELLILVPAVIFIGLRMTHRVAGPAVRLLAALRQMTAGDYSVHITLRKHDALGELAEAVNTLAESLRSRRKS